MAASASTGRAAGSRGTGSCRLCPRRRRLRWLPRRSRRLSRCRRRSRELLHPIQPDLAIEAAIFFPARVDLDVEEEVDFAAEQGRQLGAGRLPDRADAGAALAQHDRLLARLGDEDLLVDDRRSVLPLLELLRLDRAFIGKLGVELEVELL